MIEFWNDNFTGTFTFESFSIPLGRLKELTHRLKTKRLAGWKTDIKRMKGRLASKAEDTEKAVVKVRTT